MGDEWDDGPSEGASSGAGYGGGRSFGRGRGGYGGSGGRSDHGGGGNNYEEGASGGYGRRNGDDGGSRRGGGGGRDFNSESGGRGGGGNRDGGNRDGGNRDGGNRDGGNRDGGNRDGGNRDGGDGGLGGGEPMPERPKPVNYIPDELSTDEKDIFNAGIESGINFSKYENIECKVSGENVPPPIMSFEQAGLRSFVLENVKKSGYRVPTPVQKHSIPIIMAGRDLMSCAQTGSGKTAAFLVPMISVLLSDPRDLVLTSTQCQPHAIIVSPTRELALQIYKEAMKYSHGSTVRAVVAYGGITPSHNAQQVLRGCHILVATPGRLNDFVGRGTVSFASVRFFIMDEADRMLDMGFLPDMEKMLNHPDMVPKTERQTLMFSATFPDDIQRLATNFLNEYIYVMVGIVGGACEDVEQNFYNISKFEKRDKLIEMLKSEGEDIGKVMVFVETKRSADFLASFLSDSCFKTTSIHGDREQRERETALKDFTSGRMPVLVATAVAARGLDIKDVSHVVNYDLPKSIDEYVHRIGRTGRVGNRGKATSFYVSEDDSHLAGPLVRILRQAKQAIPDWLAQAGSGGGGYSSGGGDRDIRRFDSNGGGNSAPVEEEEW